MVVPDAVAMQMAQSGQAQVYEPPAGAPVAPPA
jgi:hypothetical protein